MQQLSGLWLSELVDSCKSRLPSPNPKIIKNLCTAVCCDPDHTPKVLPEAWKATPTQGQGSLKRAQTPGTPGNEDSPEREGWKWNSGIVSLAMLQREVW